MINPFKKFSTKADVDEAIKAGWVGAVICASATLLLLLIGKIDNTALIEVTLLGIVAWRVYRNSRAWAVVGLTLFVGEKLYQIANDQLPVAGAFLALVLLAFFILGVRGTFALHKGTFNTRGVTPPAPARAQAIVASAYPTTVVHKAAEGPSVRFIPVDK